MGIASKKRSRFATGMQVKLRKKKKKGKGKRGTAFSRHEKKGENASQATEKKEGVVVHRRKKVRGRKNGSWMACLDYSAGQALRKKEKIGPKCQPSRKKKTRSKAGLKSTVRCEPEGESRSHFQKN